MHSLAHKIELKPNNKQKAYFERACGVARFAWNWVLAAWNEAYEESKEGKEGKEGKDSKVLKKDERLPMGGLTLKKEFNKFKKRRIPLGIRSHEIRKSAAVYPFERCF